MSTKVGLLLPRSVIYPQMSFDIMNGLKQGAADAGIKDLEVKTENIGIATDQKLIYAACEKMLFDGCIAVAGYMNAVAAEQLEPLFAGAGATFILLDAGNQYPSSMQAMEHVFTLSLQGALCSRVVAKAAQEEGKKKFAYTGSFYDAGYRTGHAYSRSLEEAGGRITFNHITKLKRSEFTLEPLIAHLQQPEADAVLASFCGDMMQDFFSAAASDNVFAGHQLYGASFMGEEQWLAQSVYPGADVKTCVPWASALDNEVNKHFVTTLAGKKQRANIFSVLGWEAAQLIAAIDKGTPLEGMEYDSPRGTVTIDAATHQAYAPVYEAWIQKNEATGNCILTPVRTSPHTEQQRQQLEQDINNFEGSMSSWHNAYACLDS